jgi:hypothetical protein
MTVPVAEQGEVVMDLGKPIKVVEIPEQTPASKPFERTDSDEREDLIPLPAEWPTRKPARVPQDAAGRDER